MTACLDCGRPGNKGSRCPSCQAAHEKRKGEAYGPEYRQALKEAKRRAGDTCPNCGNPYTATRKATGGHKVAVRRGGTAAEGVEMQCQVCNYGWRRTGL